MQKSGNLQRKYYFILRAGVSKIQDQLIKALNNWN